MGWSYSMFVRGQFSTDGSPLALYLYSSEQYSVHRFNICRSSLRHFPQRSWTVVAFPCFTVVTSFTSWYALLLLFFLRFSSISLPCSPIQFSLAFFMLLLMLLFTSLYFAAPSGSDLFGLQYHSTLPLSFVSCNRIHPMQKLDVCFQVPVSPRCTPPNTHTPGFQ